ncbi:putative adipose-regulatory protein-domain-containing protein [Rhodocollybia butyracea]|uniref:Adipose-regulatory protein-domain-containing protein n=1 Tax=Rhodocollybia butyracea TaxID=206335 RepID=A0A9P5Q7L6_9AGAR|nr:putative adipose-regulatory protein-domain-containing protein [Rhodocollybia butyracea]
MDAETAEKERYSYGFWNLLQAPIDFLFQTLRPYTPNLVSLFVFFALIPLLAFLSLSAGLIVWQNVAVGWQIPLYLQYGDNLQPYAHAILPDLSVRQPYDVVLQLAVPSSESNFALGNFMSALTLSTNNNKTLATVRRPALVIPPKSTFFSSKPHLITIDIPMLDSFVTGTSQVVADVMIGRQDVWKNIGNGEGRELSVFSASLKGILVHKGFRGLVTRFPTFFSMVCSAIFFAILFSILAGCLLPSILQSSPENDAKANPDQLDDNDQKSHLINDQYPEEPSDTATNASEPQEEKDDDNLSQSVKSARRRRRRSTKNKNASEGSSIKSESEPVMIRSDSERSTNPLRRRRSKTLEVDT